MRKRTIEHSLVVALSMPLVALMFVPAAHAASSVVHDPTGDSTSPASYNDVVHGKVTEQVGQGTLIFSMVLAGSIPEAPSEADLIWPFHVDTNSGTAPGGLYNEYVVRVRWFNGTFGAQVIDRTPLLSGRSPAIYSVAFSVGGPTIKVSVPLALLGDPATVQWNASARPGQTVPYADFAPDTALAVWQQ